VRRSFSQEIVEEFRLRLQNLSELIKTISGKIESIYEMVSSFNGITGFFKKMMHKKTDEWVDEGAEKVHDVAKNAVERAVETTARKMRGAAKKIRKEEDEEKDIYN
jgi:tRNA A37 threonylcarbamoyltransferase TsaD